ncbi:MAG: nicotinate-nucleotide adenylyltransferase [Lachnospiraceae bacterium]|nr:nicotinate-nucleotide adenylyltransferase [Lachnospiraceae bacterium]
MARIGIMGGTFDPIHNGHIMLGRQAKEEYELDQIWFMPSGQPPHKTDHRVTDARIRWEMAELALKDEEGFVLSDFEIRRPGNTYTAQTLTLLKKTYPEHDFYFIIGADSLYEIERWYEPERVMEQTAILVASREYEKEHPSLRKQIHHLEEKYGARIMQLHCREMDVSSEEIRGMAAEGKPLDGLLPKAVAEYVKRHHLYEDSYGRIYK